jgi:hypothetical protein
MDWKAQALKMNTTATATPLMPTYMEFFKILGFYGGDYEECHLLGYENPVRNSQETRYVSATESSLLMLCKI